LVNLIPIPGKMSLMELLGCEAHPDSHWDGRVRGALLADTQGSGATPYRGVEEDEAPVYNNFWRESWPTIQLFGVYAPLFHRWSYLSEQYHRIDGVRDDFINRIY